MKRILSAIAIILLMPIMSQAIVLRDISNQISSLEQILANLQASLIKEKPVQLLQQSTLQKPTQLTQHLTKPAISYCPSIYSNLRPYSRSKEVSKLQSYLTKTGEYRLGRITGFYGRETIKAVKRYQARNGIVSYGTPYTTGYGRVGPKTRRTLCRTNNQYSQISIQHQTTTTYQAPRLSQRPLLAQKIIKPVAVQQAKTLSAPPKLYRKLYPGYFGSDVSGLQKFLTETGDYTLGRITGYYGFSTKAAVTKYQLRNGIVGSRYIYGAGLVGPHTFRYLQKQRTQALQQDQYVPRQQLSLATSTVNSVTLQRISLQQVNQIVQPTTTVSQGLPCHLDDTTVVHGQTKKFYSTNRSTFCSIYSAQRTCNDGVLSGESKFQYKDCQQRSSGGGGGGGGSSSHSSCTAANGSTISHNATEARTRYQSSSVPSNQTCQSEAQTRVCSDGSWSGWSGSYTIESCEVMQSQSCTFNSTTIAHNATTTAYQTATVPAGSICQSETRTCVDSALSGSYTFSSCTPDTNQPPAITSVTGTNTTDTITNNTYTINATDPEGQALQYAVQWDTLDAQSDWQASSSFSKTFDAIKTYFATFFTRDSLGAVATSTKSIIVQGRSCILDGVTIVHGGNHTFHSTTTVPVNVDCSTVAQSRTCTDGDLGVAVAYQYANCSQAGNITPNITNKTTSIAEDIANNTTVIDINDETSGNDTDAEGQAITYSITTSQSIFAINSSAGVISIVDNSTIDFETTTEYILNISATDGTDATNTTVTINITNVNEAPTANATSTTVTEGSNDNQIQLTGSDPDAGTTLTFATTTNPQHGTLILSTNTGLATYTPTTNYNGNDTFEFEVSDSGLTSVAIVSITVSAVNTAPVITSFTDTANTGTTTVGTSTLFTANINDAEDGSNLSYAVDWDWSAGDAEPVAGDYTATSSATLSLAHIFDTVKTYVVKLFVKDSSGAQDTETTTITIASAPVPAAPSSISGWSVTQVGIRIGFVDNADNETGFRIYDSANNIVGDSIPAKAGTGAAHAHTLTGLNCDTPYAVHVVAYNNNGESSASNIKTFQTSACNATSPTANASASLATVELGNDVTFTCVANDAEVNITSYKWLKGSTEVAATASFTTSDFIMGDNTYTCKVRSDDGATATSSVTMVAVDSQNHTPTATQQSVTTDEDTSINVTLSGEDIDGNNLSYSIVDTPSNGALSGTVPNLTYTPNANYNGNDSFTFKVNDGAVDSVAATISITINSVNDAPTANAGEDLDAEVNELVTIVGTGSDIDGTITYQWSEGGTTLANTANFEYTPLTIGTQHTLELTVTDNDGATTTDTMIVTVTSTGVPAAPSSISGWSVTQVGIRIGFVDNADNETGFRIYDSANNIVGDSIPAKDGAGAGHAYTITGLTCDTPYTVHVVAYNAHGESAASNIKNFRTSLCDNVLPTANASASPTTVELGNSITFTCVGNDTDGNIASYKWLKGSTEVAATASFTTSNFSVGENVYTCEVRDDRGGKGREDVTITATSNNPTAYTTATPPSIMEEDSSALRCLGNETYAGGIAGYAWSVGGSDTIIGTETVYNTPTTLVEADYTYTCKVTYNDGVTATDDINLSVVALAEDLRRIDLTQNFEGYETREYNARDENSPLTIVSEDGITASDIDYIYFGIKDVDIPNKGTSKAFCAEFDVKNKNYTEIVNGEEKLRRRSWKQYLTINDFITEPTNMQGKATLHFDYKISKDTVSDDRILPYDISSFVSLNEYNHTVYMHGGSSGSQTSGYLGLVNIDPGMWNQFETDRYQYRAGHDNPDKAGNLYGIEPLDTGKELTDYAVLLQGSGNVRINFCIDNLEFRGNQLKQDIFNEQYGAASHQKWNEYLARTKPVYDALVARKNALGDIANITTVGLSVKQDYQRAKLVKLKEAIDDRMATLETAKGGFGMARMDVRRADEFISRYEGTYAKLQNSIEHPIQEFNTYNVPAMKYGRLDGFTFPMDYSTVADDPYNLTMAKGEYKSIAILLDPAGDYNATLKFANTDFTGGGVTLDKYISKIWYQSGKDNSTFDSLYPETRMPDGEGTAWLTQELLLKNDALISITRDPNEKNMIYYKGDNYLYSRRGDNAAEDFGAFGSVPGYVKVSTTEGEEYSLASRFQLPLGDADLLHIEDASTIQPFALNTTYKLLWGIVHVDEDATTGVHTAHIEIRDNADNSIKVDVPVTVNVLNYKLNESVLDYGLYYHGRISGEAFVPPSIQTRPGAINKTWTTHKADLQDMYDHGVYYPLTDQDSGTRFGNSLDMMNEIGFPKDKIFAMSGKVMARETTDIAEVQAWKSIAQTKGFGTFHIPIIDEPSITQIASAARFIRDTLRDDDADVKVWGGVASHGVVFAADYYNNPIISHDWTHPYNVKKFKAANSENKVYVYGEPQTGIENPEVYRRNYGIKLYQEGIGGAFDYAYQKQYAFYWNDFDVKGAEANHREEAFTYPTTEGRVGTIQWEGYRDAITDIRYLSTLLAKDNSQATKDFIKNLDIKNGDLEQIRQAIVNKIAEF